MPGAVLKDMKALVTGASRGIGRAVAVALAKAGCDVAVNYHSSEGPARQVAKEIEALGRKAVLVKADVANEAEVARMASKVKEALGAIDILVNNAGIHQHLKFWELSVKDWDEVIRVNLTGALIVTKAFIEDMKERKKGAIINISSIIGLTGTDHEIHYAASKAGILGMTKSMALELGPYGITVNAVAPGWIDTDMTADFTGPEAEEFMDSLPISRVGRPEEIASAVVFLASKDAAWMTGSTVHVNGGWGMY
jgi:3-oxoacyl-[acyl-carrier protein] reductase